MKPRFVLACAAALAVLGLLAAACGGDGDGGDEAAIRTQKGLSVAALGTGGVPAAGQVEGRLTVFGGAGVTAEGAAPIPAAIPAPVPGDKGGGLAYSGAYAPYPFPAQAQGQAGITVQGFGSATADADAAVLELSFGSAYMYGPKFGPEPYPDGGQAESGSPPITPTETPISSPEQASPPITPTESWSDVVVTPSPPITPIETPPAAEPITEEDLQPIIDAIVAAGVPADKVEFLGNPYFDPYFSSATLRVTVDNVDALESIVQAATAAAAGLDGISLSYSNVSYTVSDCTALEKAALAAAVEDADERAVTFAEVLGVGLGSVEGASSYSYFPYGGSPCDSTLVGPYPMGGVSYMEGQSQEVQVVANVSITYGIQ